MKLTERIKSVAPEDIEYIDPVFIRGVICHWLYKVGVKKDLGFMRKDIITRMVEIDESNTVLFITP